jgi:O-antigen ligase
VRSLNVRRLSLGANGVTARAPWDLLLILVGATILLYLWRVHDLVAPLRAIPVFTILSILVTIVYFLDRDPRRGWQRWRNGTVVLALLILGLMLLSVPLSLYPGQSFSFIFRDHIKTLILTLLIAGSIRCIDDIRRLAAIHLGGAAITATTVLLVYEPSGDGRLLFSYYYDPNDLALLLVCTIPLGVYFFGRGSRLLTRALVAVATGAIIMAVVATESRGAFLALTAICAYVLVSYRAISARARWGTVALLIVLLIMFGTETFWNRMATLLNPQADYNWAGQSEGGRMEIWRRGLGYMVQRPFGVGAQMYGMAEGTMSPAAARQTGGVKWGAAHNSYLEIGVELGVPGLIAFVALLVISIRNMRASANLLRTRGQGSAANNDETMLAQAMIGSIIGYMVAGFFLSQAYSKFLYLAVIPMVAGLATIRSRPPQKGVVSRLRRVRRSVVREGHPVGQVAS